MARPRGLHLHVVGMLRFVSDINQLSLPTPFTMFFGLFLSYGPFTCISFHKFLFCSPSLISALLVLSTIYLFLKVSLNGPRSGELRTQKLKSHLVRRQSLNLLPLKPGLGQCIVMHTTPTARDSSLLLSSFRFIQLHFPQNLARFFPVFNLYV